MLRDITELKVYHCTIIDVIP